MTRPLIQILSTRPLDNDTITLAKEQGLLIDQLEFINTVPVADDVLTNEIQHLAKRDIIAVFTSMNAVQAVADMLGTHEPVWRIGCIGQTTQLLVETLLPHCNIVATGNSAKDLANNLVQQAGDAEVFFFCSNIRREELPEILLQNNIRLHEKVVYNTLETPVKLEKEYSAILFFSPSAVRSFFSCNHVLPSTVLFATGKTTAAEIKMHTGNTVIVADAPGKQEVINKLMEWHAAKSA